MAMTLLAAGGFFAAPAALPAPPPAVARWVGGRGAWSDSTRWLDSTPEHALRTVVGNGAEVVVKGEPAYVTGDLVLDGGVIRVLSSLTLRGKPGLTTPPEEDDAGSDLLASPSSASVSVATWRGGAGRWHDGSMWTGGDPSTAADVDLVGVADVIVDRPAVVHGSVELEEGTYLTLDAGASLCIGEHCPPGAPVVGLGPRSDTAVKPAMSTSRTPPLATALPEPDDVGAAVRLVEEDSVVAAPSATSLSARRKVALEALEGRGARTGREARKA